MSVPKRILIVFMLLICFSFSCFANMPVIDVTAIATALMDYYEKISQWQSQLQQWQSEFDRIQKAAEGIANGDFMTILSSVASLTKQMSTWNLNKTVFDNDFIDRALSATSDSTYSLINIISNSELLNTNLENVMKTIENNIDRLATINSNYGQQSAGGYVGSSAAASSNILSSSSSVLSLLKSMLLSGSSSAKEVANIYNNFAELFTVTPEDYAKFLKEIQADTLYGSTQKAKTTKELQSYISSKEDELAKMRTSLAEIDPDATTKKAQTEASINNLEKEISALEELLTWSRKLDTSITEVESNQTAYDYEKASDERRQALIDTQEAIEKYKAEISKEKMDDLEKLSQKYRKAIDSYPSN